MRFASHLADNSLGVRRSAKPDENTAEGKGGAMTTRRVNPATVQKFLAGISYPCGKEDLVNHAREHGADQNVIQALESFHQDTFNTASDVSRAIGEME